MIIIIVIFMKINQTSQVSTTTHLGGMILGITTITKGVYNDLL